MLFVSHPPPTPFECIDDESAELILQLQLADLEELRDNTPGKQRAGESQDVDVAANVLEENMRSLQVLLADKRMTKSIARAVERDGALIVETVSEEATAHGDHELARRMGGRHERFPQTASNPVKTDLHDDILAKLAATYISEDLGLRLGKEHRLPESYDEEDDNMPEGSAWAARRSNQAGQVSRRCVACHEHKKFFDVIAAPCQHEYCRTCLQELFEASLSDESLFPPRCCRRDISPQSVEIFLTGALKERFQQKLIEYNTRDRTYCHQPACSAFISGQNVEDEVAKCSVCSSHTCTICKAASHDGRDCPNDTTLQQMLDLAESQGWRRCYSCGRMVELDTGCNHMTCVCRAEFCYVCGQRWKECPCDQWDETRLYARANVVVRRDAPRLAENNPERVARVNAAAQMLQERHECAHGNWRFVEGGHQCEECRHHLPQYIFECRRCRIRACNRCRRNRL